MHLSKAWRLVAETCEKAQETMNKDDREEFDEALEVVEDGILMIINEEEL